MGRNSVGEGGDSSASSSAKAGGYPSGGAGKSKGRGNSAPSVLPAPTTTAAEDRFAALKPNEDSGTSHGQKGGNRRQHQQQQQPEPWYQTQRRDSEVSNFSDDGEADESSAGRAKDVIFTEIKSLVETNSCLVTGDFDFRVRQHLHAFYGSGGRERVRDCLVSIHESTKSKTRQSVKNWPAYLGALMKKFDADSATGDREARARARVAAARAAAATSNSPPKDNEAGANTDALSEVAAKPAAMTPRDGMEDIKASQRTPPRQLEEQVEQRQSPPLAAPMGVVAEASAPQQPKLINEFSQLQPPTLQALPPQAQPQHHAQQVQAPEPRPPTQPPSQPPLQPPTRPPAQPPSLPPMEPPQLPPHYLPQHVEHQTAPAPMPDWLAAPVKRPLVLDFPLEAWAAWLRSPPSQPLEAR